jgi:hypothetical protein
MTSIHNRTSQINQALLSVVLPELKNLKKFLNSANPQDISEERNLILTSLNKSVPYVEIKEIIEEDKDKNPSSSYYIVGHGAFPDTELVHYGTFGKDEILEAIYSLEKEISPNPKKGKGSPELLPTL